MRPGRKRYEHSDERTLEQQRERYGEDTAHRRRMVWVMVVTTVWMASVLTVLVLAGLGVLVVRASVLNTLLATTTANVLGLPYVVLRGLFR